jgi:hypothetical protein
MSTRLSKSFASAVIGVVAFSTLGAGGTAFAGVAAHPNAAPRAVVTLPQKHDAQRAAAWLASNVNAAGYVSFTGSPDLSDTTLTVLALTAAGNEHATALRALDYLKSHVSAYADDDGHDGAGQLATLILDAHSLGVSPTSFGGTNLVKRLLNTLRTTGPDAGLFGVQEPTYDGAYRQGLALAALAAVGMRGSSELAPAIAWLKHQQCKNGGWEAFRSSTSVACTASDPSTYSGPDTNSTALAVEGLEAQHVRATHNPETFFKLLQSSDGGWGYYGGAADPDSTGLVIQALVALHDTVSSTSLRKGQKDGASALLSFQLNDGSFFYPTSGSPNTPSGLATEQAIPALMSKAFPF